MIKKSECPKFHKKKVVAHPDEELELLYTHANDEERFSLDFSLGTMARDSEAFNCKYADITGTTITIEGKQRKTRCTTSNRFGSFAQVPVVAAFICGPEFS